MSAASLNDYTSGSFQENRRSVLAEQARLLDIISRKAQDKTLTLQETTDLYARFNSAYEASNNSELVDESWALELLKECEKDDITLAYEHEALQTHVNGIPQHQTRRSNQESPRKALQTNDLFDHANSGDSDAIFVESKAKLRHQITFEPYQFRQTQINQEAQKQAKTHQRFAKLVGISGLVTLSIVLGFAWFF